MPRKGLPGWKRAVFGLQATMLLGNYDLDRLICPEMSRKDRDLETLKAPLLGGRTCMEWH